MKCLVISASASGAGKTMITLGLLRALKDRGVAVASAKSGPDYIDPQFHRAASGVPCVTLDAWAMSPERLRALAAASPGELLLVEGAMGLFDGASVPETALGRGSTADVATCLGAPVVLVLDVAAQAQSAAAVVQGFAEFSTDLRIAGVILNRVGSPRHADMIRRALQPLGVTVLGAVPRSDGLETPSRHLGLVQADERVDLQEFIERAASLVAGSVDLEAFAAAAANLRTSEAVRRLEPPGQRIAVARDLAFAFCYPHLLDDWRAQGAELTFFSPLEDEGPDADADTVYLPGGYPELHGAELSAAGGFRRAMLKARENGALIYGECGGYMVLGDGLVDADGARHEMLGFLPLETSFAQRRLHLGYRTLTCGDQAPWSGRLAAHEFHYASIVNEGSADRLFEAADSMGETVGAIGLRRERTMGSFAHVIDRAVG